MISELLDEAAGWSSGAIDAEFRRLELEIRERHARQLALLAAIDRNGVGLDGHRSSLAYLRATTNQGAGRVLIKRARLVRDHPAVGEALATGRIGPSQVDQIARIHANPRVREHVTASTIAHFTERGEHRPLGTFAAEVDQWLIFADQDGAFSAEQAAIESRTAHVVAGGIAGLDAAATGGDAITAETMANIFRQFVDDEVDRDVAARSAEHGARAESFPLPRTVTQRRFDAFRQILLDAHAWRAAGRHSAGPPDPVVNIVCDQATFHDLLRSSGLAVGGGELDLDAVSRAQLRRLLDELTADPNQVFPRQIRTASDHPIHPRHVLQALLTGWVRRVLVDARGTVIDLSERTRCFTGSARTAATLLMTNCVHPGCEVPAAACQIDHNVEHHAGGTTTQANARPLCPPHNRFKHQQRWRTERADNGRIYAVRPDGSITLFVGESPPTFAQASSSNTATNAWPTSKPCASDSAPPPDAPQALAASGVIRVREHPDAGEWVVADTGSEHLFAGPHVVT